MVVTILASKIASPINKIVFGGLWFQEAYQKRPVLVPQHYKNRVSGKFGRLQMSKAWREKG